MVCNFTVSKISTFQRLLAPIALVGVLSFFSTMRLLFGDVGGACLEYLCVKIELQRLLGQLFRTKECLVACGIAWEKFSRST